jgi:hypothetical protein
MITYRRDGCPAHLRNSRDDSESALARLSCARYGSNLASDTLPSDTRCGAFHAGRVVSAKSTESDPVFGLSRRSDRFGFQKLLAYSDNVLPELA